MPSTGRGGGRSLAPAVTPIAQGDHLNGTILCVTHCLPLGGANRSLLGLLPYLRGRGISVAVVAPFGSSGPGELESELTKAGVQTLDFPVPLNWGSGRRRRSTACGDALRAFAETPLRFARAVIRSRRLRTIARRVIERLGDTISAVYTNSSVTDLGQVIADVCGSPHIWHLREVGGLHYKMEYHRGRRRQAAYVARATKAICVSEAVRGHFLLDGADVEVIDNGVLPLRELSELRASRTADPAGRSFGGRLSIIGCIHPAKMHAEAIRGFAIAARSAGRSGENWRLACVGPGGTNHLRSLASDLGVGDRVDFTGPLADVREVLLHSDVLLVCSRNEAFGRVTAEAQAMGAVVIGHNSGGTPELVRHEDTGLIYGGGPDELASAVRRVADDRLLFRRLQKNGFEEARRRYSLESYQSSVSDAIASAASSYRCAPSARGYAVG